MLRLAAALTLVLAATPAAEASLAADDPRVTSLRQRIARILDDGGGQGAAVAVVGREGILHVGGVGLADVEGRRPVSPDTVFQVASVSKLFIGLAIQKLVADGRLSLDTPLAALAPDVAPENPWSASDPIRLRHLLEHTTGLQEVIAAYPTSPAAALAPVRVILQGGLQPARVRWRPGTVPTYSNYNYLVLADLIERTTGLSFDDYIRETLFLPLGMRDATFRLEEVDRTRLARGYAGGPERPLEPVESFYRPSAGMFATADDLARFMLALLHDGALDGVRIASPEAVASLERPSSSLAARHGLTIGHGLGAVRRQMQGRVFAGHTGIIDGFMAQFYYARDLGIGYVILLNAHALPVAPSMSLIRDAILELFFADRRHTPVPAALVPAAELARHAGFYRLVNPRFRALEPFEIMTESQFVRVEDGVLMRRALLESARALEPLGGGRFRFEGEIEAHAVFGRDEDGNEFLHIAPNSYLVRASPWPVLLAFGLTAASVVLAALYVLAHLFCVISRRRGRLPLAALLPLVVLLGMLGVASTIQTSPEGTSLNAKTALLFLLSAVYPVTALAALARCLWLRWRGRRGAALGLATAAALASLWLAILLARGGWVGIALWRVV
jgi:CubicO group peptidase (beta-lactamase class C family)